MALVVYGLAISLPCAQGSISGGELYYFQCKTQTRYLMLKTTRREKFKFFLLLVQCNYDILIFRVWLVLREMAQFMYNIRLEFLWSQTGRGNYN